MKIGSAVNLRKDDDVLPKYKNVVEMLIRLADRQDAQYILRWRNDPQTRAMSRNDAQIDECAHNAWFERVLGNRDRLLLVGITNRPIGMVRFDRQNGTTSWEISIALAPEERGNGTGRFLLNLALAQFFATHPKATLLAEIKQHNVASRRLFESLDFITQSCADGICNYIKQMPTV